MRATEFLGELAYKGNIGIMELIKFHQIASPEQRALMKQLLAAKKNNKAWELLKQVTGVELKESGGQQTTLNQLYDGNFPERDESFWDEVRPGDFDTPLTIHTMPRHKVEIMLLGQYRIEHLDELTDRMDPEQKEVLERHMNDPALSSKVIVISGHRIIDGNHRALAAAYRGVPINYVDLTELDEPEEIDEKVNPDVRRGFKHTQKIGEFVLTAKAADHTPLLTILCYHKGARVGEAQFAIHSNKRDSWLESDITWVDLGYRGQGVASIMYAYAKMLGNDVKPSGDQLPPGRDMWKSWKKSGEAKHLVAEEINPDIRDPNFKHRQEIGDFVYTAERVGKGTNSLLIRCLDKRKVVGTVIFDLKGYSPLTWHLEAGIVHVNPKYKLRGIASTMYAYAKMLGNDVQKSGDLLPPGKAMWKAWEKSGADKHLVAEAAPQTEKEMTQCSAQDLQKLLGKGKMNALIRHPWFQEYRNYEHAYKHGVTRVGFAKVEVYPFFREVHTTADGRIRPLIMLQFTFSYGGTKVIQVEKYFRDKEPDENEKRLGPAAGWKHMKSWAKEENAVEKAWNKR